MNISSSTQKWREMVWHKLKINIRQGYLSGFRIILNKSLIYLLILSSLYVYAIFPLKDEIDKLSKDITELQSDIIEVTTLLGYKSSTASLKYFSLPKGAALSSLLKDSLDKFELRYSGLNIKEENGFIVSVNLEDADYATFMLWLDFLRKNYALRPIELEIKINKIGIPATSQQVVNLSNPTLKISLRLKGVRL